MSEVFGRNRNFLASLGILCGLELKGPKEIHDVQGDGVGAQLNSRAHALARHVVNLRRSTYPGPKWILTLPAPKAKSLRRAVLSAPGFVPNSDSRNRSGMKTSGFSKASSSCEMPSATHQHMPDASGRRVYDVQTFMKIIDPAGTR